MNGFFADTHSCIDILARNKKTDTQICHQLLRLIDGFDLIYSKKIHYLHHKTTFLNGIDHLRTFSQNCLE